MDEPRNGAAIVLRLRRIHGLLDRILLSESLERLNEPGAVGIWSVKDVITHIAFWERYVLRVLEDVAAGQRPDLVADDETEVRNASVVTQYYLQPWARVLASWHEVREDLIEALEPLTQAELHDADRFAWLDGRPLIELIAGNAYEHEEDHYAEIERWLRTRRSG